MNQPDTQLSAELSDGEALIWFDKPRRSAPTLARQLLIVTCVIIAAISAPLVYALATGNMSIFAGGWVSVNEVVVTPSSDRALLVDGLLIAASLALTMFVVALLMTISIRSERYGLSNRRLIRTRAFPWRNIASINPASIALLQRGRTTTIGSVTLVAVSADAPARVHRFFGLPTMILHDIADPAHVEHLLLAQMPQRIAP